MDYSQFSAIFSKVKDQKLSPQEAASSLNLSTTQTRAKDSGFDSNEYKRFYFGEPYLRDHLVDGQQVLIGVTYASLAVDYGFGANPHQSGVRLSGLEFRTPVVVKPDTEAHIRIEVDAKSVDPDADQSFNALCRDVTTGSEEIVASGKLRSIDFVAERVDLAGLAASLTALENVDEIYTLNSALSLGPSFKSVSELYVGESQVLARVVIPESAVGADRPSSVSNLALHPLLINSAFIGLTPLVKHFYKHDMFLPLGIRGLETSKLSDVTACWLLIRLMKKTDELILFDVELIDDNENVRARFEACALKRRREPLTAESSNTPSANVKPSSNMLLASTMPSFESSDLLSHIRSYVTQKIVDLLKIDASELDVTRNIMDMGLASAQLVEVGSIIEKEMDVQLDPTLFFEYTNVEELSAYFLNEHSKKFSTLLASAHLNQASSSSKFMPEVAADVVQDRLTVSRPTERDEANQPLTPNLPAVKEPIAIIGMHGQFAQADNLEEFWQNLWSAKDVMREVPADHWDYVPWFDANMDAPDKTYCKWGSFIDGVDQFDAGFFGISRREAEWMDPQVRLLLQSVYASADDAGYSARLRGTDTGVFVGACFHDYQSKIDELNLPVNPYVGVNNTHTVLANRVSYHFDLTGPSVTVDTACSSSLVALHQACLALHNNECEVAFVCGVNLLLSSMHYRVFSSLKALSPTGRCHSFDASADGYVPGECIASILLKPLSAAIRDGDHIEAVIRGSAALHGGYTPSFTAPSIAGEKNVILKAWEDAEVDPETITYIEAHGTGTKLGDPIEVNGLKRAFSELTPKQNFCSIGSAKSNIGHAEGAAGLAGVLKVILQMKHRKIPPLMAFTELNPYVDISESALRLDTDGTTWESPAGVPRRSGVSSFGVAGAYAHVVLEEFIDSDPVSDRLIDSSPVMMILSAKSLDALRRQVENLLAFIQDGRLTDLTLADAAFTLQVGRQGLDFRLAAKVASVAELQQMLAAYLKDRSVAGLYRGSARKANNHRGKNARSMTAPEVQVMTAEWVTQGEHDQILDHWVNGGAFDWRQLHEGCKRRVLSMPTYPFEKASYWLPESEIPDRVPSLHAAARDYIHPLLHQNVSDLSAQRYRTRLTGSEFFLDDHRVRGDCVLPGVTYLEMARAAVSDASARHDNASEAAPPIVLSDIVWMRPIVVAAEPKDIYLTFGSASGGILPYEIYCLDKPDGKDVGTERTVFSCGNAMLAEAEVPRESLTLDLTAMQGRCTRRLVQPKPFYQQIASLGLDLGVRLQGIEAIHVGHEELLVQIRLPDELNQLTSQSDKQYVVHPTMLDASLQACAALLLEQEDATEKLALPHSLHRIEIHAACSQEMWAHISFSNGARSSESVRMLDIDLCDEQGKVCVRIHGLAFKMLATKESRPQVANEQSKDQRPPQPPVQELSTLMVQHKWIESVASNPLRTNYANHKLILCDLDKEVADAVSTLPGSQQCQYLQGQGGGIALEFEGVAEQVLASIQACFAESKEGPILFQVVFAGKPVQTMWQALTALLKTAELENSQFFGQIIEFDTIPRADVLLQRCRDDSHTFDRQIRYQEKERLVLTSCELDVSTTETAVPWKPSGVYLITGGAGQVGRIIATEIAQSVQSANLILVGRSAIDDHGNAQLDSIRSTGTNVEYHQLDVADRSAVTRLIGRVVKEHGLINGIVHCAGALHDGLIRHRHPGDASLSMGAKVRGLVNLDEASKDIALDFLVSFSSIAGVLGNAGQADYALGNAFMDSYAHYRLALSRAGLRHGQTLSINWPLWQEGGMRPDEATLTLLSNMLGLAPLKSEDALHALYQAFTIGSPQIMVLAGEPGEIRSKTLSPRLPTFARPSKSADVAIQAGSPADAAVARSNETAPSSEMAKRPDQVIDRLLKQASLILKTPPEDIDVHAQIDTIGFNSIALTELANAVNRDFGVELTPTVFYEHTTLEEFGGFLAEQTRTKFDADISATVTATPIENGASVSVTANGGRFTSNDTTVVNGSKEPVIPVSSDAVSRASQADSPDDGIAIVGVSGCFPMAENLQDFWRNLRDGKDCISEIPAQRWDWQSVYGDPQQGSNKSNVKWGGFIDSVAEFDPLFFGISPREASLMDPQQRLLMTHTWQAIEDAGYSAKSLSGTNTAIFVGTTSTGYGELLNQRNVQVEAYTATGIVPSVGPNRMSYFLNLRGPSEPIETACSSSLVAIHRGVQLIRSGECDMALVGGVNTILSPELHMSFNKAGMLSEDGRCKTFAASANGFSRGEGAGMMLMKTLAAAKRDGDHVYGVIRGSAQNHGGRAKSLTAPNPKAQAALLAQAYRDAGIDPNTVGYIETHGTGTKLGDPIEVDGLKLAFGHTNSTSSESNRRSMASSCGLGSVKSNIGHLELAAGVAGVMKVLLQLKHKTLAKSLHCDTVNPYIQLQGSPFHIVHDSVPWDSITDDRGAQLPRRAGVSSFGFGGANCHVIIEEYVDSQAASETASGEQENAGEVVVVLSAKNMDRLAESAKQLLAFLDATDCNNQLLSRLAYTLQIGRDAMESRFAVVVESSDELKARLAQFIENVELDGLYIGQTSRSNDTIALLEGEDGLQQTVGRWLQQREYTKLLPLWVQGLKVNWDLLHHGSKPQRMSLPTYPFARDEYWVPAIESSAVTKDHDHELTRRNGLPPATVSKPQSDWSSQPSVSCFLEKAWQRSVDTVKPRLETSEVNVALICDGETIELARSLSMRFVKSHIIDLSAHGAGLAARKTDWSDFNGVIDLVGCGYQQREPSDQINIVQRFIENHSNDGAVILCVTRGLERLENSRTNLAGAPTAGLYRMLQSEYRSIRSRHIDTDSVATTEAQIDQIASEFFADSDCTEVCFRKGVRYVSTLKENSRWMKYKQRREFPSSKVLWVTGGTRGLGYLCAKHFVSQYGVRRLVLTGQTDIPARDQWERIQGDDSAIAHRIRSFLALEELGVELMVGSVSLSDPKLLASFAASAKEKMGDIGGVVHCAGSVSSENAAFVRKSEDEFRAVLAPKIDGLNTLYSVVQDEPLEFFVLFSSVSAIIPSLATGLSDYSMANAYMDYFAESKTGESPVVSIQWPQWQETGMGGTTRLAYDRSGLQTHSDVDGLEMLDSILANPIGSVVMPAVVNPKLWLPTKLMHSPIKDDLMSDSLQSNPTRDQTPIHAEASDTSSGKASAPLDVSDSLTSTVERWLIKFFAEELRVAQDNLSPDIPFQEYGMESVMLAQVVGRMERSIKNLKIDPSHILENPTIRQLAQYLSREHSEEFAVLQTPLDGEQVAPAIELSNDRPQPSMVQSEPRASGRTDTQDLSNPTPAGASDFGLRDDRVAVVGLSGHFPDAPDIASFWSNLMSKRDSVREVPRSRWDTSEHYRPGHVQTGKSISKWGAFLDGIEDFDPAYFKISDSLAIQMDPLERQWLEVSAEAIADAGYADRKLWGKKVGVFVGARTSNYRDKLSSIDKDVVVGLGQNFIAAHLAHIYNFKGPNFVVDAACASALTAIHLAVQSINSGESEMALAGGVEVLLDENPYVVLSTAQVLSPAGRCRTFDESADGIGLGEGCAVLVLKKLSNAISDGDKIYGVIDGSAINNDGNTMGITTPNPSAQSELIESAISVAEIDPATITYVETHGTGTLIGDPIELNALTKVFDRGPISVPTHKHRCGVGSVKSNIGHLLSAAGGASIVKVLLSIVNQQLAPTIHCDNPNPRFNFQDSALYVVENPTPWDGFAGVRRAGISSFGLGGNNAHIIVSDEGIPPSLRATFEPRGEKVIFNRTRFWPSPPLPGQTTLACAGTSEFAELDTEWTEIPTQHRSDNEIAMLNFFDVKDVSDS